MNSPSQTSAPTAESSVPWVGVHTLAEFVYCPRAGLLVHEQQREDLGEELDRAPRLDYLPDFDLDEIRRALQTTWNDVWMALAWSAATVLLVGVLCAAVDTRLGWLLIPAAVWTAGWLYRKLKNVAELAGRLQAAESASPRMPSVDSTEMQPVDWWELLQAGFTPVEYEDSHSDEALHLVGRPWRVLHHGSLRIPVFKKTRGKPKLSPQHELRIAAYCQLLEAAEGGQSPYGIVLFGSSHQGTTIPMNLEIRKRMHHALQEAQKMIDTVQSGGPQPDAPQLTAVCGNCHHGQPRRQKKPLAIARFHHRPGYLTKGKDDRIYHSACGDRFRWVPPHDTAAEKGLT